MTTPQRLDADLGWVLARVTRAHLRTVQDVVSGLPGGPRGYQVLAAAIDGEVSSQLAIARMLGVDRTVLTYLIDELERARLVERRPDPADRRARRVVLTDAGRERLGDLDRRLRGAEERLLAPLEPAERDTLRELLRRLATEAGPGNTSPCAEEIAATEGC